MPFLGKTPTKLLDANVNIDGGNIDGTTIGATSTAPATVTTFTSTGIDDNATSTKLTVSDSGIDVTGTVTSDGLTVDGDATFNKAGGTVLILENSTSGGYVGDGTELQGAIHFKNNDSSGDGDHIGAKIESYVSDVIGRGNLEFYTGRSDTDLEKRMTIDSSGNVGIGGEPVSSIRRLMITDTGDCRVDIRSGSDTNLGAIDFSDTSNTARGQIIYDHSDDSLQVKTLSTERMRIDSSGNVGIGTSTIEKELEIQLASTTTTTLGQKGGIQLSSASGTVGNGGEITWSSGAGNTERWAAISGHIIGNSATGSTGDIVFATKASAGDTSPTERMRVRYNGNVGINYITPDVPLCVGVDAGSVLAARFGTLGTAKAGDDVYIRIQGNNTANANKYIDLRHLVDDGALTINGPTSSLAEMLRIDSDGIKFNGDTAAANALDDYEEGTWTPSPNYGTVSAIDCIYTKIGNTVHVSGALANFSDYTTTDDIIISGLPFTSGSSSTAVGAVMYRDVNLSTITDLTAYVGSSSSTLRFYVSRNDGAAWTLLQYNNFDSGLGELYFSVTYRV